MREFHSSTGRKNAASLLRFLLVCCAQWLSYHVLYRRLGRQAKRPAQRASELQAIEYACRHLQMTRRATDLELALSESAGSRLDSNPRR